MDKIKYWWDSIKYLTKFDDEGVNNCRMYYVQLCKQLSEELELPKQNFGPSVMCSHCGSLWFKNASTTRIISGKPFSKAIKKIIKSYSKSNEITKFRASLMKKSLKNNMNKIIIKCLICLKNTEVSCNKPKRLKSIKVETRKDDISISKKKKKKKVKDKTAGLNISNIKLQNVNKVRKITPEHVIPKEIKVKKPKESITPVQKVRKINLKKISNLLNESSKVQKSRHSLSNFLKELY